MILLIDAGNTRIKWGLIRNGLWLDQAVCRHHDVDQFAQAVHQYDGILRIFGASVANEAITSQINDCLRDLAATTCWLHSSHQCCGVHNHYQNPAQLGADRWAALIGARSLYSGTCLVVTAGTATTADVLDATGNFLGGIILPSAPLMRHALADNTAQLPFSEGCFSPRPRNTADAIASGCLFAQVGAIEQMFRTLDPVQTPRCLLSGGGSSQLADKLTIPLSHIDNLVLKGLAVIAQLPHP